MMDLSGDWHSYYRYPSTGRGADFWGQNTLRASQNGTVLRFESLPESPSYVLLELELTEDGKMARGTWRERTDPDGYYEGAEYEGTIELRVAENGGRLNGVWHGTDKEGKVQSDIWELARMKKTERPEGLPERWKATHWYPTSDDDGEESDQHEMKSYWSGDTLVLESVPPGDGSYMLIRLHIQDGVATGNWYETASLHGEFKGAEYSGAGQMLIDPDTNRMEGLWAGAGYNREQKKMQIYTGRWEIVPAGENK